MIVVPVPIVVDPSFSMLLSFEVEGVRRGCYLQGNLRVIEPVPTSSLSTDPYLLSLVPFH